VEAQFDLKRWHVYVINSILAPTTEVNGEEIWSAYRRCRVRIHTFEQTTSYNWAELTPTTQVLHTNPPM
jgi:hypothetical protein